MIIMYRKRVGSGYSAVKSPGVSPCLEWPHWKGKFFTNGQILQMGPYFWECFSLSEGWFKENHIAYRHGTGSLLCGPHFSANSLHSEAIEWHFLRRSKAILQIGQIYWKLMVAIKGPAEGESFISLHHNKGKIFNFLWSLGTWQS